jgi:hypothetical protein
MINNNEIEMPFEKCEKYDPEWLVKLAEEQYPNEKWIAEAFSNCTKCTSKHNASLSFVTVPNGLKKETEFEYIGFSLDGGENIGFLECYVDKKEYCIIHVDFLTRILEDDEDPQYWRYTEHKRRKKEIEEDIEADLTRKDGFFGLASKSGGPRSSRKAPSA